MTFCPPMPPVPPSSAPVPSGRILLTGAAGFVGRHLRQALAAACPAATLLATAQDGRGGCVPLDITDQAAVAAMVAGFRPTACIHLAAISAIGAARTDPALAWRVNLHGTLHLAEAVRGHVPGCLFLFVSSADIYGGSFGSAPLDETALPAPLNAYAATKAAADLAVGALAGDGLRALRLRPFNHIGPGQSESFVVAAFARQIARIEAGQQAPRIAVGALDPARDFLDVRDVCAAYVACLGVADRLAPGSVLNIASGRPRRIGDVLAELLAIAGVRAEVAVDAARLRPADIPLAVGDAARARALLGWRPAVPWCETLAAVLADWRQRVQGAP